MITRTRFSTACLAFAIVSLCLPKLSAQTVAPAQNGKHYEPLQMITAYGDGKEKRRVSHQGVMEPVGFPLGQPIAITLQFLRKRAGSAVEICIVTPSGDKKTMEEIAKVIRNNGSSGSKEFNVVGEKERLRITDD